MAARRPGRRSPSGGLRRAAILLALTAAPAAAEEALHPAPGTSLSLTISGGVSLGAYEAGVLYYTLAWLRESRRAEIRLATGASAGSVNSLLSVVTQCGGSTPSPAESLLWRTWVPLGLRELFVERDVTRQAALSRRWLEQAAEEIAASWRQGLRASCDVVVGIAATRVLPRQVELGGGALRVPRVEERFVLRIQGRGPGRPPRLTNYFDPQGADEQLLLPEGPDGEVPFEALRDLIFASTAFPLAFAPVSLAHCTVHRGDPGPPGCPAERARRALFVDGAIFDSTPLRLAAWLSGSGLRDLPGGSTRWLDEARPGSFEPPRGVHFVFVSPDVTAYPEAPDHAPIDERTTLPRLLGLEAGAFLASARTKNLEALSQEFPQVADRVAVPPRHFPAASSPMLAFLGFFEGEFRRFDFYLGMYDARRVILERVRPAMRGAPARPVLPEEAAGAADWRPFGCLRAILDELPGASDACRGEDLRDFRILAQTSLERLYDACRPRPGEEPVPPSESQCVRARAGGEPPRVPGVEGAGTVEWRRREDESEVAWVVRLLAAHRFLFRDMGLERDEAPEALRRIRLQLGKIADAIAGAQPVGEGIAMERIGQLAANALAYVPPRNILWLTLGREVELGYSRGFPEASGLGGALRLHAALQLHGVYSLLSSDDQPGAVAPMAGVGFAPASLGSLAFQFGALVRAGWLFSHGDDWGAGRCSDPASRAVTACSRFTAQAAVGGVLLEVLRLQVLFEWYPPLAPGQAGLWSISPALGVQLAF